MQFDNFTSVVCHMLHVSESITIRLAGFSVE